MNFQQRYWARRDLAVALLSELTATREQYWRVFGKYIQEELEPGQPLKSFGARVTTLNFTVVYDNNADKLGFFEPKDTNVIVHAMTVGKGHIESIGQAYEALGQMVTQMHDSMRAGQVDAARRFGAFHEQSLIEYGDILREESRKAVAASDAAITVLRKYASLGPAPRSLGRDSGAFGRGMDRTESIPEIAAPPVETSPLKWRHHDAHTSE